MKYLTKVAMIVAVAGVSIGITEKAFAGEAIVQDFYKTVTKNIPQTEQICEQRQVPIYENTGGASAGDVLGGMIIGGLLGKGVTGNDKGAAAGAVIGGMVAADKGQKKETVIVGYKQEQQCSTQYVRKTVSVRGNNVVTVEIDGGMRFQFETKGCIKKVLCYS